MKSKITIEDIAREAQVGRGTVSRVINNHPSVSSETRAHVLHVIKSLNYTPNFSARHMRTASSNLVGFVADEVITTPYAVDMIRGAQETLWAHGKMMLVVNTGNDRDMTQSSIEMLIERRVEGIIYAAMFHRSVDLFPLPSQIPTVLANCFAADGRLSSVVPNEIIGGYNATRVLLDAGHRRIAFINLGARWDGRPEPLPAAQGRLIGYKRALAEFDIAFDPDLVRVSDQHPISDHTITRMLAQLPNPPTGYFCGTDRIAMGCYSGLASLGLRIPHDVGVVGFDNVVMFAEAMSPPLTTIQLPHYNMGKWAVNYLLEAQEGSVVPTHHMLDCPIVRRESV
jgi:LacI family transcriptional regulator